jgi:ABC-2 type transport system permease protein
MRVSSADIYTIWLREWKRLLRSRVRLIVSLAQPLLWLILFGTVFNRMLSGVGEPGEEAINYQSFLVPGIVAMTVLFGSIFAGIGIIFDREFGFLKEIMVAPVSRTSIVWGKALGGATSAVISGMVILGLSTLIGADFTPDIDPFLAAFLAVVTTVLIALAFVNLGIAFATKIDSMEGFQMVMNLLVMPMFFLSGAFYPVASMPTWLQVGTYMNPLFYGVDALRHCFNGTAAAALPLGLDLAILAGFTLVTATVSIILFKRME